MRGAWLLYFWLGVLVGSSACVYCWLSEPGRPPIARWLLAGLFTAGVAYVGYELLVLLSTSVLFAAR